MYDDTIFSFKSFWTAVQAYQWWQVAIELLLIGSVVFWIIRFLRGTRGGACSRASRLCSSACT